MISTKDMINALIRSKHFRNRKELSKMQTEGKKIKCDRCGLETFVEKRGDVNMDGGFTRGSTYEPAERWETHSYGDEWKDLCPACSKQLQKVIDKFWNS